jgi:membrane fusion protein, multidrug efflux system
LFLWHLLHCIGMRNPDLALSSTMSEVDISSSTANKAALQGTVALLILLLGGAGVRAYVNHEHAQAVARTTQEGAARVVLTTYPKAGQGARTVALPATLRGQMEASLYARTNGYVKQWHKDLGDRVRQGELLAIIDTPEIDQDLAQARAEQDQIKARLHLAQTSLARWEGLRQSDAVSQQELDERRSALQQLHADLTATIANVKRLQQLHDFSRITAPFDGVVVRRGVELGALVSAGSGNGNKPLYELAQARQLRLSVAVPQTYAADVVVGKEVAIKLLERPNMPIKGKIARVAGGLDVATRSVQVEVVLPNNDGKLLPGAYVEVNLALSSGARSLLIPPNALQFRQDGARVAVVDASGRLAIRHVKLGRDLGRAVEVVSGLTTKDAVVLNPHDTIIEGERVLAREAPPDKPEPGKSGQRRPS